MTAPLLNRPLPKGWHWVKLGEVAEFLDSRRQPINAPERTRRKAGKPPESLYPYYGANGQVDWIDSYLFDEPTVLLAEDGGFFGSASRPIAYRVDGKYWVNNHAHVLRPRSNITLKYLHYSLSIRPDVGAMVSGSTRGKLNQAVAAQIPIPLSPLEEQRRIVARLDEQMGAAERARRAADRMAEAARALPSAVLRKAFPAREENLPQGWRWVRLGDICDIVIGKTPSRNNPAAWGGNHVWVKISDMDNDPVTQTSETLSDEGSRACSGRLLNKGTLLYSFKLTIGKTAFAGVDLFTNEAIAGLIPKHPENLSMPFLQYALSTADTSRLTGNAVKGKTLNKRSLAVLPVPFPPFEEQQHIVTRIEEQMTGAKQAQREAEAQAEDAAAVAAALLREAFPVAV